MIPGLGKIDPKKMQAMMRQMGINQEEIDASEVIIKTPEKNIIITNPTVQKITMQGQESFQISGEISEESAEKYSQEDIELVMEKTHKSKDDVVSALEEVNGDIAEAIIKLSE